ncbi:MAG: DUF192 domain-containing protein [Verrucomicrobia bacterium]|nr:MAG: DUF192 domain-containing protein [Verrucomicrobiota bacterium]
MKTFRTICAIAAVAAAAVFSASCSPQPPAPAPFEALFPMRIGQKSFLARVACSDGEKAQGLMFVKSLPQDRGMLFVYRAPQRASFWMKDTFIALDIGFFDKDGILLGVEKLYPHNLDPVRSAGDNVAYCLETNAGWFGKNGIKSGDRLDKALVDAAIAARTGKREK